VLVGADNGSTLVPTICRLLVDRQKAGVLTAAIHFPNMYSANPTRQKLHNDAVAVFAAHKEQARASFKRARDNAEKAEKQKRDALPVGKRNKGRMIPPQRPTSILLNASTIYPSRAETHTIPPSPQSDKTAQPTQTKKHNSDNLPLECLETLARLEKAEFVMRDKNGVYRQPMKHQLQAVGAFEDECRRLEKLDRDNWQASYLLAHEAGLGKTATSLMMVSMAKKNPLRPFPHTLVIVPSCVRDHWCSEAMSWLGVASEDILSTTALKDLTRDAIERAKVIIVSEGLVVSAHRSEYGFRKVEKAYYEAINGQYKRYENKKATLHPLFRGYDVVIVDEVHRERNDTTARCDAVMQICRLSQRRIGLTGTPIVNSEVDYAGICLALQYPSTFPNFRLRCSWNDGTPGKLAEATSVAFRQPCYYSREKESVLNLPPLKREAINFEVNVPLQYVKRYNRALSLARATNKRIKDNYRNGIEQNDGDRAKLIALQQKLQKFTISPLLAIQRNGAEIFNDSVAKIVKAEKDERHAAKREAKEKAEAAKNDEDGDFGDLEEEVEEEESVKGGEEDDECDEGDNNEDDEKEIDEPNQIEDMKEAKKVATVKGVMGMEGMEGMEGSLYEEAIRPDNRTNMLPALCEEIKNLRQKKHRLIICASEHVTALKLAALYIHQTHGNEFGNIHLYHGGLSTKLRRSSIDNFLSAQNAILFLSIKAGGVGLHLVPGCEAMVFFGAVSYAPAHLYQCMKRIHRMGQRSPITGRVEIKHLVAYGSIDAAIYDMHSDKLAMADCYVDGKDIKTNNRNGMWRRASKLVEATMPLEVQDAYGNFPPMPQHSVNSNNTRKLFTLVDGVPTRGVV